MLCVVSHRFVYLWFACSLLTLLGNAAVLDVGVPNWVLKALAKSSRETLRLIFVDSWNWEHRTEENNDSVLLVFCVLEAGKRRS